MVKSVNLLAKERKKERKIKKRRTCYYPFPTLDPS